MKLKIKKLEIGPMILTGSKVLKAIMDNYTPPIDLLVRESIQNSADAINNNKQYGIIKYNIGKFNNNSLCSLLEEIDVKLLNKYKNSEYDYISISDSNTCGLLGEPIKSKSGNNNLYNLVYDFMNDKDEESSGGSWGIGKSIYYRYGNGLCFYYTRTFENNGYVSKLAGALIQNEKDEDCLIGKDSSGIAYFGELENGLSRPIYNEKEINDFLNVFGLTPYDNDKTGTVVIIPYMNVEMLLKHSNNDEDPTPRYWFDDIESCLNMSIQRWYFPRINNESYDGKYLKVAVNNKMVTLCSFFGTMQSLYNGDLKGCTCIEISGKGFAKTEKLGDFKYKLFSNEELDVHIPPNNNPSPKYFVDSNNDCDKNGLLFYTRKPGMILNYDNLEFGSYAIEENKYLIGVFKLNDSLMIENENLGQYMKKTEKANHIKWSNDIFTDYPILSKKKPYIKICGAIKAHLNETFNNTTAVTIDGSSTILQKRYGEKLLPPSDFGNEPSIPVGPKGGGQVTPKKNRIVISSCGISIRGNLLYTVECIIQKNETFIFDINIKTGAKALTFEEWEDMEFTLPCKVREVYIEEFTIGNSKKPFPEEIIVDDNYSKRRKKIIDGDDVYKIQGLITQSKNAHGFLLYNATKEQAKYKIKVEIIPIDNKYSLSFNARIEKGEIKYEQQNV